LGGLLRRGVQVLIPPESTVWIKVTQGPVRGLWFKVNPRFEIGYLLGKPEEPVLNALLGLLSQGGCFYDVGAHIGFYALLAARIGCRVYAFEPDPLNVERLRENIERNELSSRIKIIEAAVYAHSAPTLVFQRADVTKDPSMMGGRILSSWEWEAKPMRSLTVAAISLDDFVFVHGNEMPHVIKVDVEGSEAEVLKGSERLFSEVKPSLICEVHQPETAMFITDWLANKAYHWKWLESNETFPRHLLAESA